MVRAVPEGRVSILVVTYDHAGEIDACLDAAAAQAGADLDVEVVVADNASRDGTAERVAARGDVRLLRMGSNRGFAAAMNAAFAASTGEWVLILNPDCVMDPGAAAALRAHLAAHPGVAVASALLRGADGSPQLFARTDADLRVAVWAFTEVGRRVDERLRGGRGRAARRYEALWADGPPREPFPVYCPAAACVMAARADLEPAPFDERFPLFFNDGDLYSRLWRQGRSVHVVPGAGAAHGYGTSIARAERADPARMRAEWVASLRRYAARYWTAPARAALWALLLADAAATAALAAVRHADPATARGTLGGLGLPGGAPPLLTRLRGRRAGLDGGPPAD
jgi:GT2 family glycosyltransferase